MRSRVPTGRAWASALTRARPRAGSESTCRALHKEKKDLPQMNTDKHRFLSPVLFSSVFICVHLWLNSACFGQSYDKRWLSGIFYGEGANFGDFNKDGKLDVVSG